MPRHSRTRRFLASSLAPLALAVFLYAIIPPLRSLSPLKLAGCFLLTFFVVSRLRRAFRPRPEPSPESVELRELLRQVDRMMAAENASPRSRQTRAKAGGTAEAHRPAVKETLPIASHETTVLRWCGQGATVRVGPYALHDPLVYVSDGEGFVDEVSCIDLSLPVGKPIKEPPGSLGYFPEYYRLSPRQRANYLGWLAGGRSGSLSDSGYALLFFYGLERRLFLEGKDAILILEEVGRLHEMYPASVSFQGALSRFLAYCLARAGIDKVQEKWFEVAFERTRAERDEQHLAVGLAWLFSHRRPLPPSWALRVARLDPGAPRSVVLERLPGQFEALFLKRYRERHGDGLLLRAARRDRQVTYRPASPSLSDDFSATSRCPPVRVPDVLGIPGQFSSLVSIWAGCIEELKPLSRVMARGGGVLTRAAYDALPDELRAGLEHPDKPAWERLAGEKTQEDGTVLVEAGELAGLLGIASRPKLTARQGESLAQTAHAVGFVIEPDARVTGRPYGWGDLVALYRPEEAPSLPANAGYPGAALMLELGMFVAAADGRIEDGEVGRIAAFLESQFQLDPPDVRRLEALKRVFLRQHPSIGGIGKRLKAILGPEQLESVGEFLVGVAASNDRIDKKAIAALRSAYKALGIDARRLERSLEETRRLEKEPVEVRPTTESPDAGEAIPPRPSSGSRPAFRLDPALLEKLMHETRQVASMLDEAMQSAGPDAGEAEEPVPEPLPVPVPEGPADDVRFEGLDGRYRAILAELCTRPCWPRGDFEALVRRHSLMPSGTLDVINGWAYERFDDPILEGEGEDLIVHAHLVGGQE